MNEEQTIKAAAPGRRPALRRGVAVVLVLWLAGVVFWTVRNEPRGPVELSFEGYKWENSSSGGGYWVGKFKVKNNSPKAISFYGLDKVFLGIEIKKANSDVSLYPASVCGSSFDWCVIRPGEEVLAEQYVGEVKTLWQAEFKYVPGKVAPWQAWNLGDAVTDAIPQGRVRNRDWLAVRSTTAWPVRMGPFTLARK